MFNKRAITLKKKLAKGAYSPGIWVSLSSPTACEVIADAGFDWVVVDGEHSSFNPETLQHMLMAFKASDTVPLIRVAWNDQVMIKQALDMGWDGVVVPQVNSADDARRAVTACRYPPQGRRGYGPRRAGNYYRDQEEYVKMANDSVICVIQIEDVSAADQIEDIVKVRGIDWVFLGICDMSGTTGRFLDTGNAELRRAIRKILGAAQAAGIPTGNAGAGGDSIEKILHSGCRLVVLGEDTIFLKEGADKALTIFRETIKRRR